MRGGLGGVAIAVPVGEAGGAGDLATGVGVAAAQVVDGLAANGEEGNAAVEASVKARVEALCKAFPIYPGL